MGRFIESLRQRLQQENKDVQKEAEAILEAGRKQQLERERILRERSKNMPQWEEAKRQFNESGLLGVFKKVIDLKGAESYYVDPENFDEMLYWKFQVGTPYFYVELHIEKSVKEHDEYYYVGGYSNKITTKYIGVRTDQDGNVSFRGSRLSGYVGRVEGLTDGVFVNMPIVVKVPKTRWQGNPEVLEDALGKVYHLPVVAETNEMIDNPVFDRHFGIFKKRFDSEHKEPGV